MNLEPIPFLRTYLEEIRENTWWEPLDEAVFGEAVAAIEHCHNQHGTVYVCGNGGSWCTAAHFACDLAKTPQGYSGPAVKAVCLGANPGLLTATANDVDYEGIFAEELLGPVDPPHGVFVGISASGNSENVINACYAAERECAMTTIGFSGFDGGKLKDMADISIHVPSNHYGIIEDGHMIICHAIAYHFAGARSADGSEPS